MPPADDPAAYALAGDLANLTRALRERCTPDDGGEAGHVVYSGFRWVIVVTTPPVTYDLAPEINRILPDHEAGSLLHLASDRGHEHVAQFLLYNGAKVNTANNVGNTPLHLAVLGSHHKCLAELSAADGVDLNARDGWLGNTPLHWAATKNLVYIVSLLAERGADVNARNKCGETPLHLAAKAGHEESAAVLLVSNASTDLEDDDGRKPLDVAVGAKKTAVAALLKSGHATLSKRATAAALAAAEAIAAAEPTAQTEAPDEQVGVAPKDGRLSPALSPKTPRSKRPAFLSSSKSRSSPSLTASASAASIPSPRSSVSSTTSSVMSFLSTSTSSMARGLTAAQGLSDLLTYVMIPGNQSGPVTCLLERKDSFFLFYLQSQGSAVKSLLLVSTRRRDSKTSNWPIGIGRTDMNRASRGYVGKLRANSARTDFTLYSRGDNPDRQRSIGRANVRAELAKVKYSGSKPRQLHVIVPSVKERMGESKGIGEPVVLQNLKPVWDEKAKMYLLPFSDRVTESSSRNFILMPTAEKSSPVMQMGKCAKDTFALDFSYPLSAFQAFGIALTAFDVNL